MPKEKTKFKLLSSGEFDAGKQIVEGFHYLASVFWDIMPRRLAEVCGRFERTQCLNLQQLGINPGNVSRRQIKN
jgi:hypothetical protein